MSEDEFLGLARQFISGRTGAPVDSIGWDDDLVGDGVLDSLLLVEFFFFLEELSGREIPADDAAVDLVSSIGGAYELLRLASSGRPS